MVNLLNENPSLTIKELAVKFKVSEKTIYRSINKLKQLGKIIRIGSDKEGYWKTNK